MGFIRKYYRYILLSIPVISLLMHLHIFGMDLLGIHVWRQTETQTTINNFFREDMNILNPRYNEHPETDRLHRMEFPLMQWLFACVYKALGYHVIISRILTFIIGLFSVWGIYKFLLSISSRKEVAAIGAWCFNFSPVFYYYTVNPLPDNMALSCGIWSLYWYSRWMGGRQWRSLLYGSILLCIATMCKLPFIIYGAFPGTWLINEVLRRRMKAAHLFSAGVVMLLCLLPAISWYAWVIPTWVIGAVYGVTNQTLNHPDLKKVMVGTFISVLPELLLNYASVLFFLTGFYTIKARRLTASSLFLPLAVLGMVVIAYFLFEMNIIDLVHDYYLFPFLPVLFLLVAYGAEYLLTTHKYSRYLAMLCLIVLPLTAFLRADTRWDTNLPGFNTAYLRYKDELRTLTPPDARCVVGYDESHYILLYYIDRKGWAFDKTWFDAKLLEHFIAEGATYIFLDENVDKLPGISEHLGEKVFDKDDLRVYKLR